jgi:hypothetical protein
MTALRRKLSRLLAAWATRIDPDPPRGDQNYQFLAQAITDVVNGQIGARVAGLGRDYPGPSGTVARY